MSATRIINGHRQVQHACDSCGMERWVRLTSSDQPRSRLCRTCVNRNKPPRPRISYSSAHVNLFRQRGRAADHPCSCGKRAAHWAYTHSDPCPNERVNGKGQKYSLDTSRYIPLCRACHRRYDYPPPEECPQGHAYTLENTIRNASRLQCQECVNARKRLENLSPERQERQRQANRERRTRWIALQKAGSR